MNEKIHKTYQCDTPPILCLQADNGPEGKNKTFFAWCQLLVEMNIFEEVECNYLIAGVYLFTNCMILPNFKVLYNRAHSRITRSIFFRDQEKNNEW
jgi:hypothetical protein